MTRLREAAGVPVGLYVQGPGGTALAVAVEAARAGADPIAAAAYPVAVPTHRASSELLAQTLDGIGFDSGVDQVAAWEAALLVDQALGAGEALPPPLSAARLAAAPRVNRVPAGLVASAERHLAELGASDRLHEVLDEVSRVRDELGRPPIAPPVGLILMRQAIDHVLSGRRWTGMSEAVRSIALGEWGQTPGPGRPGRARAGRGADAARDRARPTSTRRATRPASSRPRRRSSASSRCSATTPCR